jgi:DNA-binding IclR family transcriptional regulator
MKMVPAASQVLAILRYLAHQAAPVHAASLARELALPRSTTYQLLATLVDGGFVVYLPEEHRYGLGVSAYELGSGYTRHAPLQRLARAPLASLVDRTGQSAHLAVLSGREVIYIIEERAPGRAPLVTDVGVRLPAQLTASGRALLAAMPPQHVRALFPDPSVFVMRNANGPRSFSALLQLLVETRRRGYATESNEVTDGFSSIAAVARDHAGQPIAALAVTYPNEEILPDLNTVLKAVQELSRRIGGPPS